MIDKMQELYNQQQTPQSQPWYKDRFIKKVIVFACIITAISAIAMIVFLYLDYQQSTQMINGLQKIRF